VQQTVTVGASPVGMALSPDGRWLYTANIDVDSVSVVDTSSWQVVATIPVGDGPDGIEVVRNQ
jgi:YVTN family beta-propeller protein